MKNYLAHAASAACFHTARRHLSGIVLYMLLAGAVAPSAFAQPKGGLPGLPVNRFEPVATYQVSGEIAEIVDATPDGQWLIYTDSEAEEVGFVNIADPAHPTEILTIPVDGEPTSVAVTPNGAYGLVTVNAEPSFLLVFNLADLAQAPWKFALDGQPDAIAISPDGQFAAIVIENERDEEINDGEMPQAPPGYVVVLRLKGGPTQWTFQAIDLRGLSERFPTDPEPEFVSINEANQAAVTLQENNWIVIIDLPSAQVVSHFSAGTTTHLADLTEDGQISFTEFLTDARLEPDAIGWTPRGNLVTANEGDYDLDLLEGEFVGGRNFTIFSPTGDILFDSGPELEMLVAAAGFYRDNRSGDRGVEPEGIEIARYLNHTYLFVGMERGKSVAVYRLPGNERSPQFVQLLETGDRPEGLLAIPSRALFVTANEGDGTISIFAGRP